MSPASFDPQMAAQRRTSSKRIIFILKSKPDYLVVTCANKVFSVMPDILKQGLANRGPQAKSGHWWFL